MEVKDSFMKELEWRGPKGRQLVEGPVPRNRAGSGLPRISVSPSGSFCALLLFPTDLQMKGLKRWYKGPFQPQEPIILAVWLLELLAAFLLTHQTLLLPPMLPWIKKALALSPLSCRSPISAEESNLPLSQLHFLGHGQQWGLPTLPHPLIMVWAGWRKMSSALQKKNKNLSGQRILE